MQLTSYENLTPDNIILKPAKEYKVKDSKLKYKRIQIEAKYPNGKKGALKLKRHFFLVLASRKRDPKKQTS